MQKLGQHFLKNKTALRLIAEALELQSDKAVEETVIEIGPGHGELTEQIRSQAPNAKIIAIEKDAALAKKLAEKFEVIEGDALKILEHITNGAGVGVDASAGSTFKIAGNIPYYITGHLLRAISELEQKPELCVFTIQKEVAERIIATPPRMNRLAASVQFWAEPKILKILAAGDFSPPPKVDSAIIRLETKNNASTAREGKETGKKTMEQYYAAVRIIFAQPRKTVANNLGQGTRDKGQGRIKKEGIIKILEKIGIKPNARPQDLSVEDIMAIAVGISSW
jgi:16S rRNA (adenine1518-N6/adenine1519-N6)-dimethyltransferase